MYNHLLDTFIAVVESGSFNKASSILFKTPPAIMKQINLLEEELDLKLFERKAHGITLTPQGEQIYKDALFIKDYSVRALLEAKRLEESNHITFKIGTSLLNPAKPFVDLWYPKSRIIYTQ